MVKIKFCGMTNPEDCAAAIDLSVDFVGFVFYKRSRRYIMPGRVRRIVEGLGGRVATVGVFVEEGDEAIREIVDYCGLDFAQVYRESALPHTIRAHRIGDRLPDRPGAGLILFDSASPGGGGSGLPFDLRLLKGFDALDRTFVAGGINERMVEDVLSLGPFGIDLVSSIEAFPGKKDYRKMEIFVEKVRGFHS